MMDFMASLYFIIAAVMFGAWLVRQVTPRPPAQPPFVPTEELANLLKRQPLEDRIRYLGLSNIFQLYDNYKMCLTEEEMTWLPGTIQEARNRQQEVNRQNAPGYSSTYEENRPEISWSRQKPIEYDDDDTYDNFYMQHEDEFKEMWGKDDYEDAIDDAWDEHQRDKEMKKRWGR